MNQKYTESEKMILVTRYKNGESVSDLVINTGIPRSTIYTWIKEAASGETGKKTISPNCYRLLQNKVARLQGIIEIMKKIDCSVSDPLEIKLPALEALQDQYSVHMLCEALDVPRGTYYNYIFRNKRTTHGMPSAGKNSVWKSGASTMTAIKYLAQQKSAPS